MNFPSYFHDLAPIRVFDPLARFLGVPADGVLTYDFADAVKLAGHCCPTVAGSWAMLRAGLTALWPHALPERGAIRVGFPNAQDEGVTGVMAQIATLVTGAADPGGFKGIAGQFTRAGLLRFDQGGAATMTLTRHDSGAQAQISFDPSVVPVDPEMRAALGRILAGLEEEQDAARFALLWQARVKAILVDHADDPRLIQVRTQTA